jgi:hypothetical protein
MAYTDGYDGDLALNGDGTRVFHQDGVWSTATDAPAMSRVQTLAPRARAVDVARDGRSVVASFGWYEETDIRVRDEDGFVLGSYKVAGYARSVRDAELEVSGDGLSAAAITEDPKLVFLVIGP